MLFKWTKILVSNKDMHNEIDKLLVALQTSYIIHHHILLNDDGIRTSFHIPKKNTERNKTVFHLNHLPLYDQ